jgi:DNA-3-methyladenine glycosylase II
MDALQERVVSELGPLAELSTRPETEFFWEMCSAIIGQQLSEKVAPIIEARVKTVLGDVLEPTTVLATPDEQLRAAGLSYSKISYLKNVATAWQSGQVDSAALRTMEDEEIIKTLTTIKGVGRWTVEMFLIFTLARNDIFSVGDYGLRRAALLAYNLPDSTTPAELTALAKNWQPNRSQACRILWKSLELK